MGWKKVPLPHDIHQMSSKGRKWGFTNPVMIYKKHSPASVRKLVWLLVCLSLMAWQIYRCTEEFYSNPVVTNLVYEKFTDDFLPQITVCPRGSKTVKREELERHGLDLAAYLGPRNFTWKSTNSSFTPKDVLASISWGIEDLVPFISLDVVGEDMKSNRATDLLHLWTPTIWHGRFMTCYKLDLRTFKKGEGRLKRVMMWSRFPDGIIVFVHNVDQVFDKSLRLEFESRNYAHPTHYPEHIFDVSLKVIKTLSTSKHPCSSGSFDQNMLKVATEKMMKEVGCVVPFVDRLVGSPICDGGKDADKAFEIYNNFYNYEGLYERGDVSPPCEYYVPSIKEKSMFRENKYNYVVLTTLSFSTQVDMFFNRPGVAGAVL